MLLLFLVVLDMFLCQVLRPGMQGISLVLLSLGRLGVIRVVLLWRTARFFLIKVVSSLVVIVQSAQLVHLLISISHLLLPAISLSLLLLLLVLFDLLTCSVKHILQIFN